MSPFEAKNQKKKKTIFSIHHTASSFDDAKLEFFKGNEKEK